MRGSGHSDVDRAGVREHRVARVRVTSTGYARGEPAAASHHDLLVQFRVALVTRGALRDYLAVVCNLQPLEWQAGDGRRGYV